MKFYKLQALGNDFVVVFSDLDKDQILRICDYKFGIGCDQLFIVSGESDVKIYNRDTSEVSFCGNGLRALAYLQSRLLNKKVFDFYVFGIKYSLRVIKDNLVELKINEAPVFLNFPTELAKLLYGITDVIAFDLLDIGNRNLVIFLNREISNCAAVKAQILDLGIFPEDLNMSFNVVSSDGDIKSYVIERGAGPTLSCGSSAIATAMSAVKNKLILNGKVKVIHPGGVLTHTVSGNYEIVQVGEANIVFDGEYYL